MRQPLPLRRGLQGQATSIRNRGGEGLVLRAPRGPQQRAGPAVVALVVELAPA